MTTVLDRPVRPVVARLRRDRRRWAWALGAAAVLLWSLAGAGLFTGDVVNPGGTAQFGRFAAAALSPALDAGFLGLLASSALVTVAYAVLGTALALALGAVGAVLVSRTTWGRRRLGWLLSRGVLAVPRGLHEAVWGLLLVNVLGLDPWVGILAIGIPYGAVTAKVFADLVDEVPRGAHSALLAAGAGRASATLYGLLPPAAGGLLSYSAYRLECAVRSAVVLGMVGAGGLGYQLSLSFASLRWEQVWSCVYALSLLCLAADVAGRAVRRRLAAPPPGPGRDPVLTGAVVVPLLLVAWSWWYLAVSPASLVSARTAEQLAHVLGAAWPPATDGALLGSLGALAVDTVQMSVIAIAVAALGAVLLAGAAARPPGRLSPARRVGGAVVRTVLLLLRAVPPPVWALVLLFVLLPGVLPGALALGVYTLGVLGRLTAEAVEELDPRPRAALAALGARPVGAWLYGVLPGAAGPVLAYALYRWEVAIRDTVLVGLLGAGGLGALLASEIAAFDWAAVTTVLAAIVVLTLLVDLVSDRARSVMR
ncbi:PhnE/PtxC family ABC transporter permease [Geodermatophilus sabuli]|uniref:Phosphonate transport system permease protein n=1 Tax=Geodermatophilus sabuli TaxID=1564158 RepID=A0A285E6A5_9ACTN|nr:ABC transporter permease subunit [Geodermatophilus sabuli]MBB3082577.1 phosphonate transport system permease protein [Geodermatophilus sabuli]SNX94555.1 phosphonate transport system permease protein [Geodermatophilus sabuli]